MIRQSEAGYITVTMTALLAGLSIVAMSVLNRTHARSEIARTAESVLLADIMLESMFHEITADLVNGHLEIKYPKTSLTRSIGGQSITISITNEVSKTNLNHAEMETIEAGLLSLYPQDDADQFLHMISSKRSKTIESLSEVFGAASSNHTVCARERFTVFTSTLLARENQKSQIAPDGSILSLTLQIQIRTSKRELHVTALLTGRLDEPVWIMDWARRSPNPMENCR